MALDTVLEEFVNVISWRTDERQLERIERRVDAVMNRMSQAGKKLTAFVTLPIVGIGVAALKTASDFEQLDIAFTTMLGSAERAKELREDLLQLAKTTPFEVKNIAQSAKQLLAVGFAQEQVIDTLTDLGNVSAGLSVPLERLILNFGQVKTQGKLTGRELRDFAVAGVPVLEELAKSLGKSKSEVQDLVSAGGVSFDMVAQAFRNMAREGGRFENLMEKQSKTLGGAWSNLIDTVTLFAAEIGNLYSEDIKKLIKFLSRLFDRVSKIDKRLLKLAVTFALLAAAIGPILIALPFLVTVGTSVVTFFGFLTTAITSAGVAAVGFNVAMAAIPILIALAIGALALFIEDVYTWIKGGDSLTGRLLGPWQAFAKALDEEFQMLADDIYKFFMIDIPNWISQGLQKIKNFGASVGNFLRGRGFTANVSQGAPAAASAIGGSSSNTNINQSNKINVAVTVPDGTSNSDAIDIVSNGVQNALNPNGYNLALTATSGLE